MRPPENLKLQDSVLASTTTPHLAQFQLLLLLEAPHWQYSLRPTCWRPHTKHSHPSVSHNSTAFLAPHTRPPDLGSLKVQDNFDPKTKLPHAGQSQSPGLCPSPDGTFFCPSSLRQETLSNL